MEKTNCSTFSINKVEYVIISDKDRSDYKCPGYIQHIMDSPTGKRIIVRVYSPNDPDSLGRQYCLNSDQVESITGGVFNRLLRDVREQKRIQNTYADTDIRQTEGVMRAMRCNVKQIYFRPEDKTTTVLWTDGTKSTVKCADDDEYSEYAGFCAAVAKRLYGNNGRIKRVIRDKGIYQPSKRKKKPLDGDPR